MKRRIRVLASVGFLTTPAALFSGPAMADSCEIGPTCYISGNSSPAPCPVNATCIPGGAYSGGGGGGSSGSGSIPENEAQTRPPAPPPKTPEQKAAEKAKCESDRIDSRTEVSNIYQANMAFCASSNSTSYGYFIEQWKRFLKEAVNVGPGNCADVNNTNYARSNYEIDVRRDVCVAAAERG
ncbi:MAG: hypothetical protein ACK4R2_07920 [Roseateles sp.]